MLEGVRFEGLTLTVADVERSLTFYRDKLHFDVAYVSLPAFALLRVGTGTIGLLSFEEARKDGAAATTAEQRRGIHVEFSTDDLDALYVALRANGVSFATPPHDEPWERSMTALDPDGHSVEFAQGKRGANAPPKP
jgi:catechol 2,3-dioxygenase-like lactoylglutathione lyase family enzyme